MSNSLTGHSVTMVDGKSSAFSGNLKNVIGEHAGAFGDVRSLGSVLTHSPNMSYWASTANPYSWVTGFAIAASNGAIILNESQGRWTTESVKKYFDEAEVMAADWLCTNVVMKDCKGGGVQGKIEKAVFNVQPRLTMRRGSMRTGLEVYVRVSITSNPRIF